jgi:hypothetical protein
MDRSLRHIVLTWTAMFVLLPLVAGAQAPGQREAGIADEAGGVVTSQLIAPLSREEAQTFPYIPPLDISDCTRLLKDLREQLEVMETESPPNEVRRARVAAALLDVSDYIKQLDRRTVSLDSYTWIKLGPLRVEPGEPNKEDIIIDIAIPDVHALALRAEHGRVLVDEVTVHADNEAGSQRVPTFFYLQNDSPKREVTFLQRPLSLKEVEAVISTDSPRGADVFIYAGVAEHEEFGKQSLFHMAQAGQLLGEFKLAEAREQLKEAERALIKFQWYHRL